MSTCQRAPEDTPASLPEPRRLETEPAELGRRRPLVNGFEAPPALDDARGFFTRPPSLVAKSVVVGEAGALSTFWWPKYSLALDFGVGVTGEPGRGELEPLLVVEVH